MRSFINWFLSGFAILFAIPSFLILISWNALPGDRLYSLKTGLEDITLTLTLKTPLASKLSVKYTDRRFSEASLLLSKKGSSVGYNLLVAEANQSKDIIVQNKDSKSAAELVAKIDEYQKNIEQKKIAIQTGGLDVPVAQTTTSTNKTTTTTNKPTNTNVVNPTTNPVNQVTPTPYIPPVGTPTPTPTAVVVTSTPPPVVVQQTEDEVIDNLDETNKQLEEIKQQVQNSSSNANFHSENNNGNNDQHNQSNDRSNNDSKDNNSQKKRD